MRAGALRMPLPLQLWVSWKQSKHGWHWLTFQAGSHLESPWNAQESEIWDLPMPWIYCSFHDFSTTVSSSIHPSIDKMESPKSSIYRWDFPSVLPIGQGMSGGMGFAFLGRRCFGSDRWDDRMFHGYITISHDIPMEYLWSIIVNGW